MIDKLRIQLANANRDAMMNSSVTSSETTLAKLHAALLLRLELLVPLLPTSKQRHSCKPRECSCGYERLVSTCIDVCSALQTRVASTADDTLLALCAGCLRQLTEGVVVDDPRLLPLLDGAWRSRALLPTSPSSFAADFASFGAFQGSHCVRSAVACATLCSSTSTGTAAATAAVTATAGAAPVTATSTTASTLLANQSWTLLEGLIDVRNFKSVSMLRRTTPRYSPTTTTTATAATAATAATTTITTTTATTTISNNTTTTTTTTATTTVSRKRQPPPPEAQDMQQQLKRHQTTATQFF